MIKKSILIVGVIFSIRAYAQLGETYQVEGAKGFTSEETAVPVSKSGVKMSEAYPEEINDKNYPDIIETFDYPSIEISELVNIMGELTGKRFIMPERLSGKVSISSKDPITVAQAYEGFLSALQMNDLTIVPAGKFLKIVKSRDASKMSIETYTDTYYPNSDQMITKIVKLKYIPVGELVKSLRNLWSKDGEVKEYEPTNSLIITDYGSSVEKIMRIIEELDVPGFEERMEVIPVRFAKAKDIADLINKIINKGETNSRNVPRFRRNQDDDSSGKGAVSLSYVTGDERTNSVIALGNQGGIDKAKELVKTLDTRLDGDQEGGVYVYYVKHHDAEEVAKTLGGIAEESKKAKEENEKKGRASSVNNPDEDPATNSPSQVFGSEVMVKADRNTNAIIVTASSQDYKRVKTILEKIDIPRDQVFVETVIMEIFSDNQRDIGVDLANITVPEGQGDTQENPAQNYAINGMFGNATDKGLGAMIKDPLSVLGGGILSFAGGETKYVNIPGKGAVGVQSLMGLVRLFQVTKLGNVLSTPKIMAMDNEEAEIEVGKQIYTGDTITNNAGGVQTASPTRTDVNTTLTIIPSISTESEAVRLKIRQVLKDADNPGDRNTSISNKAVSTNIVVPNEDTAVLGGFVNEKSSNIIRKVPLLGDIPILGWLFRSKSKTVFNTNLMLFITPKIVRNPSQSRELVKQQVEKRLKFIKRNMNGIDPFGEKIDEITKVDPMNTNEGWDEETPEELKEFPAIELE